MSNRSYYFLPTEIIDLLIDFLPMHQYFIYQQVPILAHHGRLYQVLGTCNYIIDAIIKNDIDYINDNMESVVEYWRKSHKQTNAYDGMLAIWKQALASGRISILKQLSKINTDHHTLLSWNFFESLEAAGTNETFNWLFNHRNYDRTLHRTIFTLIEKERIDILERSYNHKRDTEVNSLILNFRSCWGVPKYMIPMMADIKKRPKVYAWFLSKKWDPNIEEDLRCSTPKVWNDYIKLAWDIDLSNV
jgi:hypothetical protein